MKYLTSQTLRPGKRLIQLVSVLPLAAISLLFSGCATGSDAGYSSSRSSVYVSSAHRSHSRHDSYYDPYYDPYYREYSGYYYDPYYGYYYQHGSGVYGAYGQYRTGYGYFCPLHLNYFSHTHYRSHDHRRHHSYVRYNDRHRNHAYWNTGRRSDHGTRDRRRLIEPDTGPIHSTRGGGLRTPNNGVSGRGNADPNRRDGATNGRNAGRRGSATQASRVSSLPARNRAKLPYRPDNPREGRRSEPHNGSRADASSNSNSANSNSANANSPNSNSGATRNPRARGDSRRAPPATLVRDDPDNQRVRGKASRRQHSEPSETQAPSRNGVSRPARSESRPSGNSGQKRSSRRKNTQRY